MCGIFANGVKEEIKAEELVCRSQKALYDFQQSHRARVGRLSLALWDFGMLHNKVDHSVFYKHKSTNRCIYLLVYVTDIVIPEMTRVVFGVLSGIYFSPSKPRT